MDEKLKEQFQELKNQKGADREEKLLAFAQEHNSPQAYNELGICYHNKKDEKKAVEMFHKALSIQEDAAVYTNLANAYFTLAQQGGTEMKMYMQKTVEAFQASAKLNSASYFFLGNLYMPKVNAPFPDDKEMAVKYYLKVEKEKALFWAQAMKNVGLYYYHDKKDYLRAAAYLLMAKKADPKDKKCANYYEYAFGKVRNRKFWQKEMELIGDQNDVDRVIEAGITKTTTRCPKCGSIRCQRISGFRKLNEYIRGSLGLNRYKKYMVQFQCLDCNHEWW